MYAAVIGVSVALVSLYAFNVAVGLPVHTAHATESSVLAAADGHATDIDYGAADEHGSDDHHGAADEHGSDEDHGSTDEDGHGDEGLAIGAGEPVDAWGATTQLTQLSSVGLALVLLRRRPWSRQTEPRLAR